MIYVFDTNMNMLFSIQIHDKLIVEFSGMNAWFVSKCLSEQQY